MIVSLDILRASSFQLYIQMQGKASLSSSSSGNNITILNQIWTAIPLSYPNKSKQSGLSHESRMNLHCKPKKTLKVIDTSLANQTSHFQIRPKNSIKFPSFHIEIYPFIFASSYHINIWTRPISIRLRRIIIVKIDDGMVHLSSLSFDSWNSFLQ